jgi:hypothetical protein
VHGPAAVVIPADGLVRLALENSLWGKAFAASWI